MERNFGGKQFTIQPSKSGQPQIDCMFFPATHGDNIVLDPPYDELGTLIKSNETDGSLKKGSSSVFRRFETMNMSLKYVNKSTVIMCNPNALVYQWMITSANAYWLDFFLRRDCNVLIWNYRGYGETQQSIFSPNLTPDH